MSSSVARRVSREVEQDFTSFQDRVAGTPLAYDPKEIPLLFFRPRRERGDEVTSTNHQRGVWCSFLGGERSGRPCDLEHDGCDGKTCMLFDGAATSK